MEGRKASECRTVRRKKGIYEGRKDHKKEGRKGGRKDYM